MPVSAEFASKSPTQITDELLGYEPSCVAAALRYRESGAFVDFIAMLPGIIAYHLPRSAPRPPAVLADDLRLVQDVGLDSLALTEMAFLLGDLFQLSIETREVFGVTTVGDLKAFLKAKLEAR